MTTLQPVPVGDGVLAVAVQGDGEPAVLVHGGLVADTYVPLLAEPAVRDGYRLVRYHRRGYAGSGGHRAPASIEHDAEDCIRLLDALGIERPHLVGWSYGGAMTLQVAARWPDRVHSVAVLEPAVLEVAGAAAFAEAFAPLFARHAAGDPAGAAADFQGFMWGPTWRSELEARIGGGVQQLEKDAGVLFDSDLPALQAWRFGPAEAAAVTHPALMLSGTDSLPIVGEIRERLRGLLPQVEEVLVEGANHSFAVTRPAEVAAALAAFWAQYPGAR